MSFFISKSEKGTKQTEDFEQTGSSRRVQTCSLDVVEYDALLLIHLQVCMTKMHENDQWQLNSTKITTFIRVVPEADKHPCEAGFHVYHEPKTDK